jgi:hypothetical protein
MDLALGGDDCGDKLILASGSPAKAGVQLRYRKL